jgi:hypothetical protein
MRPSIIAGRSVGVPDELVTWLIALLGATIAWIAAVLVVGRLLASQEKIFLLGASIGACFFTLLALAVLVGALAQPARLTVRNESPWPIEVEGLNIGSGHVIEPNESEEFFEDSGPLWTGGFIDDVVIAGGPSRSSRVSLSNMDAGRTMEIVITPSMLGVDSRE